MALWARRGLPLHSQGPACPAHTCTGRAASVSVFRCPASNPWARLGEYWGIPTGAGKLALQMLQAEAREPARYREGGPPNPWVRVPSGPGYSIHE